MSNYTNHVSIYFIVLINAVCHVVLIWRLKMDKTDKWKFSGLALALPVLIISGMRLMVGTGLVNARVAEQVGIERLITMLASALLLLAPFLVTGVAVWFTRKRALIEIR